MGTIPANVRRMDNSSSSEEEDRADLLGRSYQVDLMKQYNFANTVLKKIIFSFHNDSITQSVWYLL